MPRKSSPFPAGESNFIGWQKIKKAGNHFPAGIRISQYKEPFGNPGSAGTFRRWSVLGACDGSRALLLLQGPHEFRQIVNSQRGKPLAFHIGEYFSPDGHVT